MRSANNWLIKRLEKKGHTVIKTNKGYYVYEKDSWKSDWKDEPDEYFEDAKSMYNHYKKRGYV